MATTGVSGNPDRMRCSCWKKKRIAEFVGRTEWKMSPAITIRSRRYAPAQRPAEGGQHLIGALLAHGGQRAADILLGAIGDQVLHLIRADAPIELQQLARHRVGERQIEGGREALHAVPPAQHRWFREPNE